jgi:hypothetical protein
MEHARVVSANDIAQTKACWSYSRRIPVHGNFMLGALLLAMKLEAR